MADLSKINASPKGSGSPSEDGASRPRKVEEPSHPPPTGGLDVRSHGEIETAYLRTQILVDEVRKAARQMAEGDHALLSQMAGSRHLRRPAGRPATEKMIAKKFIQDLYPQGTPPDVSAQWLWEKVNDRCKRDGLRQVSQKTVSRARRELGQN